VILRIGALLAGVGTREEPELRRRYGERAARNRMKRFGQLKEKETHGIGVTRGTSMMPSDRASYRNGNCWSRESATLARLLRVAIPSRRPIEVRRRTHRSRVTADGNNFRWCDGFAVMRVEGSPRPETRPSTDTPCAISATPHIADIHLRDSHVCLGPRSRR
jgi:hypothetical protein